MTQKKGPTPTNGKPSALDRAIVPEQHGKDKLALVNAAPKFTPRQARALAMLKPGHWITREQLDRTAGASNSPDLIQQLRRKLGRDAIETDHFDATDRDGKPCRPGRYRLTEQGGERLAKINATTDQGRAAA